MDNETATAKAIRKNTTLMRVLREFGPPPTQGEEALSKWVLHCLEKSYRQEAQPFIDALVQIECSKPQSIICAPPELRDIFTARAALKPDAKGGA